MIRLFAFAAVSYATVTGALFFGQRRLMYHPDPAVPDPTAAGVPEMAAVRVATNDGLDLLAWYRPAEGTHPTILYLHGNAGDLGYRGPKVRPYLDAGLGVLLLAWRGFSGNPGSPSEEGLYADGRAALAFLRGEGVAADRVVLYGESLGTGVAVHLAAETTPAALVLEAPFTSIADVGAVHYWYIPACHLVRDRFESAAKIGAVEAPLLILHGERDRVVPVRLGRALLAAANEPKEGLFVAEADHVDLYDHGAAAAVLDFLARHAG